MKVALHHDRILREVCERLNREAQSGRVTPPAGVWLLDNYAFLQGQARELREAFSGPFWKKLNRNEEKPRIYGVAAGLIERSNARVTATELRTTFTEYQDANVLTLAELWAIQPIFKLALLDRIVRAAKSGTMESGGTEEAIGNAITSLRTLDKLDWPRFTEEMSRVEAILREDPAGIYPRMDFETRDMYRQAIERVAERTRRSEVDVAREVVEQARRANRHLGFFLGPPLSKRLKPAAAHAFYFGGLAVLTALVLWLAGLCLAPVPWWLWLLLLVPASQVAISILHPLVTRLLPPNRLPRMDFSKGVPGECKSFVVIPTLLLSRSEVASLLERLEIHFLANRDPNLLFGLLTDFPDAGEEHTDQDDVAEVCAEGIRSLNERYGSGGTGPFYLFHRPRTFNACEGAWMGRERKRGKLDDFNDFLLGRADAFELKVGDQDRISGIRYVITLDTDTRLPRDDARRLIANMAHPLNRPVADGSGVVRSGHALLQPRVSVSMESARRSRLASLYSGQTGLDPYTKAVSDVYQDLFQQASYTGKGIYDLEAFARSTRERFPDNTLLSHDLIEGEHARTALVTDVELIDDYPASYEAFCKRKHRWARGDWQIAMWLLPRVPDAKWSWIPNPLGLLSRWKIFDNLRRGVFEISLVGLFLAGLFDAVNPARAALAVLAILLAPILSHTVFALLRFPPRRFWRVFLRETAWQLAVGVAEALVSLTFLLHQSFLMGDAMLRTLVRRVVSKRKLLEWESMAQSESGGGKGVSLIAIYLLLGPAIATLLAFLAPSSSRLIAMLMLTLWAASPLVADFLSHRMRFVKKQHPKDVAFLREVSLLTWRYFADFATTAGHWLVPDNVQQDPFVIAHRSSPTNMGLQLVANLAARDFGYLTIQELSSRLGDLLCTLSRLERSRGHFYNWYDTATLEPLQPRYVSSVDSGNLAASLIAVKQTCLEARNASLLGPHALAGLRDHCTRLRHSLPHAGQTAPLMREIQALCKQLTAEPANLFFWEGLLSESKKMAAAIAERIEWLGGHWRARKGQTIEDTSYWMRAFQARIDALLQLMTDLAPWLSEPLEDSLRVYASDPAMASLMTELGRVPKLSELGAQYEAIEREARELIQAHALPPVTLRVLEDLLAALGPAARKADRLVESLTDTADFADRLFHEMDFRFLFNEDLKLMRIGFDVSTGQLDDSHYDLLASEARTAVFLGIAKGDFPRDAWFHLGRKLLSYGGHRTLVSWSGTMFEYLMPNLFLRTFEDSLLAESLAGAVRIQQLYCRSQRVPWGISEAAHSGRDAARNHQYRAFGVPVMGLKRMSPRELVIAPYSCMLAAMVDPRAATINLRHMADRGWLAEYGFFESIDYTGGRPEVVRVFMAHHQGMALAGLANALLDNPLTRRFHSDPMVRATELLLQERIPVIFEETLVETPIAPPDAETVPEIAVGEGT